MAAPLKCDNDDGNLADLLVSNLMNGDTTALCGGCIPSWFRAAAAAFDQAAAEEVAAQVPGPDFSPEAGETITRDEAADLLKNLGYTEAEAEVVLKDAGLGSPEAAATAEEEGEATQDTPRPKSGRTRSQAQQATPPSDTTADAVPGSDSG